MSSHCTEKPRQHQKKMPASQPTHFGLMEDALEVFLRENINGMIGRGILNDTSPFIGLLNSTNSSAFACDPILFNLGGWSREGNNGTIDYGLCPDTYISFALVLTFVIVYIISVIFSAIGKVSIIYCFKLFVDISF